MSVVYEKERGGGEREREREREREVHVCVCMECTNKRGKSGRGQATTNMWQNIENNITQLQQTVANTKTNVRLWSVGSI